MNALHELQGHVTNDLGVLRYPYFPRVESFTYSGNNPKRGGRFEETRYRVSSLDFFDDYLFAGNVGGERPSDYARSVHYHNFIMQREGLKGVAFGFDVEPVVGGDGRPADSQPNFEGFLDAIMIHAEEFLLLHVTDPYKTHAYRFAKSRSDIITTQSAEISEIVNPFLFDTKGKTYADNVDGYALAESIKQKRDIERSNILMIGAGGVASSIADELLRRLGDGRLIILNRTESRAHDLSNRLRTYHTFQENQLITGGLNHLSNYAADADIIISAVTESPVDLGLVKDISKDTLFVDVNYGPAAKFAVLGKQTGHETVDGGPMVYYGVERAAQLAFKMKLGREINEFTLAELKEIALKA